MFLDNCCRYHSAKEDYKEYLDRIISLKIVDSIDEAIAHINYYNISTLKL